MPKDSLSSTIHKGGFEYNVDVETLNYYRKLPPEFKLQWLEEANEFIAHATDEKTKKIIEKFRKGII